MCETIPFPLYSGSQHVQSISQLPSFALTLESPVIATNFFPSKANKNLLLEVSILQSLLSPKHFSNNERTTRRSDFLLNLYTMLIINPPQILEVFNQDFLYRLSFRTFGINIPFCRYFYNFIFFIQIFYKITAGIAYKA